jgi:hypothetical protein
MAKASKSGVAAKGVSSKRVKKVLKELDNGVIILDAGDNVIDMELLLLQEKERFNLTANTVTPTVPAFQQDKNVRHRRIADAVVRRRARRTGESAGQLMCGNVNTLPRTAIPLARGNKPRAEFIVTCSDRTSAFATGAPGPTTPRTSRGGAKCNPNFTAAPSGPTASGGGSAQPSSCDAMAAPAAPQLVAASAADERVTASSGSQDDVLLTLRRSSSPSPTEASDTTAAREEPLFFIPDAGDSPSSSGSVTRQREVTTAEASSNLETDDGVVAVAELTADNDTPPDEEGLDLSRLSTNDRDTDNDSVDDAELSSLLPSPAKLLDAVSSPDFRVTFSEVVTIVAPPLFCTCTVPLYGESRSRDGCCVHQPWWNAAPHDVCPLDWKADFVGCDTFYWAMLRRVAHDDDTCDETNHAMLAQFLSNMLVAATRAAQPKRFDVPAGDSRAAACAAATDALHEHASRLAQLETAFNKADELQADVDRVAAIVRAGGPAPHHPRPPRVLRCSPDEEHSGRCLITVVEEAHYLPADPVCAGPKQQQAGFVTANVMEQLQRLSQQLEAQVAAAAQQQKQLDRIVNKNDGAPDGLRRGGGRRPGVTNPAQAREFGGNPARRGASAAPRNRNNGAAPQQQRSSSAQPNSNRDHTYEKVITLPGDMDTWSTTRFDAYYDKHVLKGMTLAELDRKVARRRATRNPGCIHCLADSHFVNACPFGTTGKCLQCGQRGHWRRDCNDADAARAAAVKSAAASAKKVAENSETLSKSTVVMTDAARAEWRSPDDWPSPQNVGALPLRAVATARKGQAAQRPSRDEDAATLNAVLTLPPPTGHAVGTFDWVHHPAGDWTLRAGPLTPPQRVVDERFRMAFEQWALQRRVDFMRAYKALLQQRCDDDQELLNSLTATAVARFNEETATILKERGSALNEANKLVLLRTKLASVMLSDSGDVGALGVVCPAPRCFKVFKTTAAAAAHNGTCHADLIAPTVDVAPMPTDSCAWTGAIGLIGAAMTPQTREYLVLAATNGSVLTWEGWQDHQGFRAEELAVAQAVAEPTLATVEAAIAAAGGTVGVGIGVQSAYDRLVATSRSLTAFLTLGRTMTTSCLRCEASSTKPYPEGHHRRCRLHVKVSRHADLGEPLCAYGQWRVPHTANPELAKPDAGDDDEDEEAVESAAAAVASALNANDSASDAALIQQATARIGRRIQKSASAKTASAFSAGGSKVKKKTPTSSAPSSRAGSPNATLDLAAQPPLRPSVRPLVYVNSYGYDCGGEHCEGDTYNQATWCADLASQTARNLHAERPIPGIVVTYEHDGKDLASDSFVPEAHVYVDMMGNGGLVRYAVQAIAVRTGVRAVQHITMYYWRAGQLLKANEDGTLSDPVTSRRISGRIAAVAALLSPLAGMMHPDIADEQRAVDRQLSAAIDRPCTGTADVPCTGSAAAADDGAAEGDGNAHAGDDDTAAADAAAMAADAMIDDDPDDGGLTSYVAATYNVRSLSMSTLAVVIHLLLIADFVGITELWSPQTLDEHLAVLKQHSTIFRQRDLGLAHRTTRRGGGVALAVKRQHAAEVLALPGHVVAAVADAGGDIIAATIEGCLRVACIYLPPQAGPDVATAAVTLLLSGNIVDCIIGDINMGHASWSAELLVGNATSTAKGRVVAAALRHNGWSAARPATATRPPTVEHGVPTSPDVIFTRAALVTHTVVHDLPGSDHLPLTGRVSNSVGSLLAATQLHLGAGKAASVNWAKATAKQKAAFAAHVGTLLSSPIKPGTSPDRAARRAIAALTSASNKRLPTRRQPKGLVMNATMSTAGPPLLAAKKAASLLRGVARLNAREAQQQRRWETATREYLAELGIELPDDGSIPQAALSAAAELDNTAAAPRKLFQTMAAAFNTVQATRKDRALLELHLVTDDVATSPAHLQSALPMLLSDAADRVVALKKAWQLACKESVASAFDDAARPRCPDAVGWKLRKLTSATAPVHTRLRSPTTGKVLTTTRARARLLAAEFRKQHGAMPKPRAPLPPDPDPPPPPLKPVSHVELRAALDSLARNKSPGVDGLTANHLVAAAADPRVFRYFLDLTDLVLAKGMPKVLKLSIVVGIFKGAPKDPLSPASMRPVSLVSTLSKLVEIVAGARINDELEGSLLQEGFRLAGSCQVVLATLLTAIQDGFNTNQTVLGTPHGSMLSLLTAIDFHGAFPSVTPDAMVNELMRTPTLAGYRVFIKSFMEGRTFAVRVASALSSVRQAPNGTPQGAVLSSRTLWSAYVNHILLKLQRITDEVIAEVNAEERAALAVGIRDGYAAAAAAKAAGAASPTCRFQLGTKTCREACSSGSYCPRHKAVVAAQHAQDPAAPAPEHELLQLSQLAPTQCCFRTQHGKGCEQPRATGDTDGFCSKHATARELAVRSAANGTSCSALVGEQHCRRRKAAGKQYCQLHDPELRAAKTPPAVTDNVCGMYVDDGSLLLVGRCFAVLRRATQRILHRWGPLLVELHLTVSSKSEAVQISVPSSNAATGKLRETEPMSLCDVPIKVTNDSVRALGLRVDTHLTFSDQATRVLAKMTEALRELTTLSRWAPPAVLASIWKCTGTGVFMSSTPALWFERCEAAMQHNLETVHAAAARVICDSTQTSHAASALAEASLHSLQTMTRLQAVDLFHKNIRLEPEHPLRKRLQSSDPLTNAKAGRRFAATTRQPRAYARPDAGATAGTTTQLLVIDRQPLLRRLPYKATDCDGAARVTIVAQPIVPGVTTESDDAARAAANNAMRVAAGVRDWMAASDGSVDHIRVSPASTETANANGAAAVVYRAPRWHKNRVVTWQGQRGRTRRTAAKYTTVHVAATELACSFSAEAHGLLAAIRRLTALLQQFNLHDQRVVIFCDTQSCLSLLSAGPLLMTTMFGAMLWLELLALSTRCASIELRFVFSHTGTFEPNEAADAESAVAGKMMMRGTLPQPPLWHKDEMAPSKTEVQRVAAVYGMGSAAGARAEDRAWASRLAADSPLAAAPRGRWTSVATCIAAGSTSDTVAVSTAAASLATHRPIDVDEPVADSTRLPFRARHQPVHAKSQVAHGRRATWNRDVTRGTARLLTALRVGCSARLGGNFHRSSRTNLGGPEACYWCHAPDVLARDGLAVEHMFSCPHSDCIVARKRHKLTTAPAQLWNEKAARRVGAYARWFTMRRAEQRAADRRAQHVPAPPPPEAQPAAPPALLASATALFAPDQRPRGGLLFHLAAMQRRRLPARLLPAALDRFSMCGMLAEARGIAAWDCTAMLNRLADVVGIDDAARDALSHVASRAGGMLAALAGDAPTASASGATGATAPCKGTASQPGVPSAVLPQHAAPPGSTPPRVASRSH